MDPLPPPDGGGGGGYIDDGEGIEAAPGDGEVIGGSPLDIGIPERGLVPTQNINKNESTE